MKTNKLTPQQRLAEAIQKLHTPFKVDIYDRENWDNPGPVRRALLMLAVELLRKNSYKGAMLKVKSGDIY